MKTANIYREPTTPKEMLGKLICEEFNCLTLERPDLNNAPQISAIPTGTYQCKYTRSTRLSKLAGQDYFTYEVLNVPNRSGIRIHSANYYSELEGCIALGIIEQDLNHDGELDIVSSRQAIIDFEKFINHEEFTLIIQ